MKKMTVSYNPTYLCNFRCSFCYLTPEQLSDKTKLDAEKFNVLLNKIQQAGYEIDHVDIYGGEVALLSEEYFDQIDEILVNHGDPSINIITNLSIMHPYFTREHVSLSVSFDFEVRERHELVMQNMLKTNKEIAILMLASPELMQKDVEGMIKFFNRFSNIVTVEIKPYSTNQANQYSTAFKEFETFIQKWMTSESPKRFEFINEAEIKRSLSKERNAFSDNHIYITPAGRFAVLEFDENDHEFFLEMDTIEEYEAWANKEKNKVSQNEFCRQCDFQGHCLTEHYRVVSSLDQSCNGFKHLLEWAQGLPT
jgi:sulfatase maturation enzyme AslB (radical SAM superfamily)